MPSATGTVASFATEAVAEIVVPSVTGTVASSTIEAVTGTVVSSTIEAVAETLVPSVTMPEIDFSPFFTDFNSTFVGDVTYLSTMVSAPTPSLNTSPPISPLLITTDTTTSVEDSINVNMDDVD